MNNNTFQEIWDEIKTAKNVLLTLHPRPDGDSLGCCTAMKYILEKMGMKVRLISRDGLSENLGQFSFAKEVEFGVGLDDINLNDFDHVMIMDLSHLGDFSEKIQNSKELREKMINIDHHSTNPGTLGKFNYVNANLSSCCAILFELFKEVGVSFDGELCRRILLGICTDTGFFEFGHAPDSFDKAAFLIEKGNIDYQREFVIPILRSQPWTLKKLHGILLLNAKRKMIDGKTIVYSVASREEYEEHGLNYSDIRLGIMCLEDIKGADIIFTLTDMPNEVKGSMRSVNFDTTLYSKAFGGGGHKSASGFIVEKQPLSEIAEKVLKIIEEKGFERTDN